MAPESWFPFFEWVENTGLGTVVRESIWAFPIIEAVHLVGLGLLGGALLVVDLRLLGLGLTDQPVAGLIRQARPWLWAGVALMLATGIPLFLSEAVKLYFIRSFWVKMIALPLALWVTFRVRRALERAAPEGTSWRTRLAGASSIMLWFIVAAAGRWIGFSG